MQNTIASPFVDLTHTLDDRVPVYPGDPTFKLEAMDIDGINVHALSCSSHAGTHIDAPSHFFPHLETIDSLSLDTFVRPALVVDLSHKKARESITWADDLAPFESKVEKGMALLIRTGWDQHWGSDTYFDHPWIEKDAAQELLKRGVKILGTDTMSPDQSPFVGGDKQGDAESGYGSHEVVLGAGCIIAENLTNLGALKDLHDSDPTKTIMVSLMPLKLSKCDGSPVRAFGWAA